MSDLSGWLTLAGSVLGVVLPLVQFVRERRPRLRRHTRTRSFRWLGLTYETTDTRDSDS